jgi:hypothetical protein
LGESENENDSELNKMYVLADDGRIVERFSTEEMKIRNERQNFDMNEINEILEFQNWLY